MEPAFRKDKRGKLVLYDSIDAITIGRQKRQQDRTEPLPHGTVASRAKNAVVAMGGDRENLKHVLGQYTIQFGKYRNLSFKWLIENCPGWVAYLVISMDRDKEPPNTDARWLNKMSLKKYVSLFPEGVEILALKKEANDKRSSQTNPTNTLVGEDEELVACLEAYESSLTEKARTDMLLSKEGPSSTTAASSSAHVPSVTTETEVCPLSQPGIQRSLSVMSSTALTTATEVSPLSQPGPQGSSSGMSAALSMETEVSMPQESTTQPGPQGSLSGLSTDCHTEYSLLAGWKKTLPVEDHRWISGNFFQKTDRGSQFDFTKVTQLWYHPPQPSLSRSVMNKVDRYFAHRLFIWMPRHLFNVQLTCTHHGCEGRLTNAGVHQKTRMVLDVDSYYNVAAEYYACSKCKKKVISWSDGILHQLDSTMRSRFPCILTTRYACDLRVVRLMRQRSLGNSSSAICKEVEEEHGEAFLNNLQMYLANYRDFKTSAEKGFFHVPPFVEPPSTPTVPRHRWFMKVYQLDVLQRVEFIKASITSTFGRILKIDSTKKITNKLAGHSRKTAMWSTNIGNEHGQVLMSVLTEGEGMGLKKLTDGLTKRYHEAGVPAPLVLYTDRDCCGTSSIARYFDAWPFLHTRLDIWHFMRRFPSGCTTDKHQLYSIFMSRLSRCIFKFDEDDLQLLKRSKRAEMLQQHIPSPSDDDVMRRLSSHELALHCKRVTRGTMETTQLITDLLDSMDGKKACDTLGVPLIHSEKMAELWKGQRRHVSCIQDPPGVQLYTQVKTMKKGGVTLPVYRCARGSTSLESFHLHLNRFIPGTLAKDTNFQVYLLDGLFRWNADRAKEAVEVTAGPTVPKTYSGHLQYAVNKLSSEVCGKPVFDQFQPPRSYTGELIGIEYLYSQTGQTSANYQEIASSLQDDDADDSAELDEDEGFADDEVPDETVPILEPVPVCTPPARPILHIPSAEEYRQIAAELRPAAQSKDIGSAAQTEDKGAQDSQEQSSTDLSHDLIVGPDNIPGYAGVHHLADFLVSLQTSPALMDNQAQKLVKLWESLSDFDKARSKFPERFSKGPLRGRFKSPKQRVAPGVETITRAVLGPNSTPASRPDCNRYVEVMVEKLMSVFPGDRRIEGRVVTRWTLVLQAYKHIRNVVLKSCKVMDQTELQLPPLNKKTLQQWSNEKDKKEEKKVLAQGLSLPQPSLTMKGGIPAALVKPSTLPAGNLKPFRFHDPKSTVGLGRKTAIKPRPTRLSTPVPLLPRPTLADPASRIIRLPLVISPTPTVLPTPSTSSKRKVEAAEGSKRKYVRTSLTTKCRKCGQERKPPVHRQYMGHQHCGQEDAMPFENWRASLKEQGVARKKKK